MEENRINIAAIGPVSAGKSTLINSLFVEQYSDMKIKRTTALPQIYHESTKTILSSNIYEQNKKRNEEIMKKSSNANYTMTNEECIEIEYFVPKVFDLVKMKQDVYLSVYDLPGLNDAKTKDVYFEYINKNFYKFDIILFVLDINSALNTADEINILELILNNIKKNNNEYSVDTKLIVLLNKCDEIEVDDSDNLKPIDPEIDEMYEQAIQIVETTVDTIYPCVDYEIMPISCEDSYIYRSFKRNPDAKLDIKYVNKFGSNEYGKTRWNRLKEQQKQNKIKELFEKFDYEDSIIQSGFDNFKYTLQAFLNSEYQYTYLMNHINYELSQIKNTCREDFILHLDTFNFIKLKIEKLQQLFTKSDNYQVESKIDYYLDKFIDKYNNQYVESKLTEVPTRDNIHHFNVIKEGYTFIKQYFKKVYKKYADKHRYINTKLTGYYIELCQDQTIDAATLIKNLDILKENDYDLTSLLLSLITEIHVYNNICNVSIIPELFSLFETLYEQYEEYIDEHSMILAQFNVMLKMIKDIHSAPKAQLFNIYKHVNKYIIDPNNTYSPYFDFLILKIQTFTIVVFDEVTDFSGINIENYESTSFNNFYDYIIQNIKKMDNDVIILKSDLFKKQHNYESYRSDLKVSTKKKVIINSESDELELPAKCVQDYLHDDESLNLSEDIDSELFYEDKVIV
jgi:predicted GTPase